MDAKVFRTFLNIFLGLILVFFLLMLVNYLGSLSGPAAELPGQEEPSGKPPSAEGLAQQALAAAKYGGGARASMIPGPGLSTAPASADGSLLVVKETEFNGVAEAPKDLMSVLNDLGGGDKRKPAPIAFKELSLDNKVVSIGRMPAAAPHLKISSMPEMGRGTGMEGVTLLSAPADYKLFKSSETWWSFANSRKLGPPGHDFSASDLLIIISLSDFPSGIFSIAGVERGKKETVVNYRVNPLAMAAEASAERREAFASAPVPKGRPVRLQQVP